LSLQDSYIMRKNCRDQETYTHSARQTAPEGFITLSYFSERERHIKEKKDNEKNTEKDRDRRVRVIHIISPAYLPRTFSMFTQCNNAHYSQK
jgi:hypothetical protein